MTFSIVITVAANMVTAILIIITGTMGAGIANMTIIRTTKTTTKAVTGGVITVTAITRISCSISRTSRIVCLPTRIF